MKNPISPACGNKNLILILVLAIFAVIHFANPPSGSGAESLVAESAVERPALSKSQPPAAASETAPATPSPDLIRPETRPGAAPVVSRAQQENAFRQMTRLLAGESGTPPEKIFPPEAYAIARAEGDAETFEAQNPIHDLDIAFPDRPDGVVSVKPSGLESGQPSPWQFEMRAMGLPEAGEEMVDEGGARIDRPRGPAVTEWYVNEVRGLEQGFTVHRPLAENRIELTIDAPGLEAEHVSRKDIGEHLVFRTPDGREALYYHGLQVTDADGRILPSRMEIPAFVPGAPVAVDLVYDPTIARYPINVDPFVSTELAQFVGSNPSILSHLTLSNGVVFFEAFVDGIGHELWKTDGTAIGTQLVKDIAPGSLGSRMALLRNVNGTLLFTADDGIHGRELWKSDGTEVGTVMVKDINPGAGESIDPVNIFGDNSTFFVHGGTLYFRADNGTNGIELWKSDGTSGGTLLIKDINPGAGDSDPEDFAALGGSVYFGADDGVHGDELWKTDGSEVGTVLVKDIRPGAAGSGVRQCTEANGLIFFSASEFQNSRLLWKSDGTELGTENVGISRPFRMITAGNTLFIHASLGSSGEDIWTSDGTAMGTELLKHFPEGAFVSLSDANGTLYFDVDDGINGRELWTSDGTVAGTVIIKDINPGTEDGLPSFGSRPVYFDGDVYFSANDGVNGLELWKTDGTGVGTVMVKDINPGNNRLGGPGFSLVSLNGSLLFSVDDGTHGEELWKTDGSEMGTTLLIDLNTTSSDTRSSSGEPNRNNTTNIALVDDTLIFTAGDASTGIELWKSDGTVLGTQLVKDINPGPPSSFYGNYPASFAAIGNVLYLNVDDGTHGQELWMSDGTFGGTVLVKDINPGPGDAQPFLFTGLNGEVLFQADDGTNGRVLWKTDGSESGTVLVKNLGVSHGFVEFDGALYFSADDDIRGSELWKTDGTGVGTVLVKDIRPGSGHALLGNLTVSGGTLFFRAGDGTHGLELWKTDGTPAGTVLVKDILQGSGSSTPLSLTDVNGTLFFIARTVAHGHELWKSDGSAAGTVLVKDILSGPDSSFPNRGRQYTNVNGVLYFVADSGGTGYELWKSDGTASGTVLLKDIFPGPGDPAIEAFTNINGTLFFRADNGVTGSELWSSNGTAATTALAEDLGPGKFASLAEGFIEKDGKIFYFGSTGPGPGGAWTLRTFDVPVVLLPQPDNWIGKKLGRQVGDNRYTASGIGQQANVKSFGRKKAKFFFTVQNDGNAPDTIRLSGTRKNKKFKPKYLQFGPGGGNVTAALFAGTHQLTGTNPGSTTRFKAVVKPQRKIIEKKKKQKFFITSKSTTDDTTVDRVLAKVTKKKPK